MLGLRCLRHETLVQNIRHMSAILDNVDLSRPIVDVVPGPRGQLLATLAQLEAPVTVRALARHAGVSPQTALNIINDLEESGIVFAEHAGHAHMVGINRAHILAGPLISLTRTRARLVDWLTRQLADWPEGLAAAWLFGSAARGDGDRGSDIDLLLVASASTQSALWADATAQLADQVLSWTGNHAQIVEHSRTSFAHMVQNDTPILTAIRAEGIALTPDSKRLLRAVA
jgi:predicted nucleotidyltransferase